MQLTIKNMLNGLYRDRILGLLLLAVTLAAYQPAWNGMPLWDDEEHITKPELCSVNGLARIWTRPHATGQYYPLVHSVFWIQYQLWGEKTTGYHLLNILLHVFSALLLVRILRKLGCGNSGAWLAGGIFALHPVMVESVAWITELKNTLSGVFFFSAALAYVTYLEDRKRRRYVLSLALFILGLLSKTAIVPFPAAMLAVVWFKRGRLFWKRDIVPLLPFVVAGVLLGLVTFFVERTFIMPGDQSYSISLYERCLIAGRIFWFYLSKIIFPVNLVFIYPRWAVSAGVWWQHLFPAAACAAAGALWVIRGRWRAPLAMFLYFFIMLFPVIGFFNVYAYRYSFVADHWQYLAAIGPIALGAAVIDRAFGSLKVRTDRLVKPAASMMVLAVLGMLTWNQSRMYADAETLYRTIIRKNPACWMAHNNLGLMLMKENHEPDALNHYHKALANNPDVAETHNNLGILLEKTGQTEAAVAHYQKALEIWDRYAKAHNNLGLLLAKLGRSDEAMTHFQKALEINPDLAESHYNIGTLLAKTGRLDEAIVSCRKALAINPDYVEALNNLGNIFLQTGHLNEAAACYTKALEINPRYDEARLNLGTIAWHRGQTDEAAFQYRKALEINPGYAECHYNLGNVLLSTGKTEEAVSHYQKALEINPGYGEARLNLGSVFLQSSQTDKAIIHYRKALETDPVNIAVLNNLTLAFGQSGHPADAIPFLQKALAAAKAAGREPQAKEIAEILGRVSTVR